MGPTWVLSAPDGPPVGPMNLATGALSRPSRPCRSSLDLWNPGHRAIWSDSTGTGQSGGIPLRDNIERPHAEQSQVKFDRLRDLHSVISRVECDSTQLTQLANEKGNQPSFRTPVKHDHCYCQVSSHSITT